MTIKSVKTQCPTCKEKTNYDFIAEVYECQKCKNEFKLYSKPCTFYLESNITKLKEDNVNLHLLINRWIVLLDSTDKNYSKDNIEIVRQEMINKNNEI